MRKIEDIAVVVLVGGYSTRLRKVIGKNRHKCMVKIGDKTFLEILVNRLRYQGLRKFIFSTGHGGAEVAKEARRICATRPKSKCTIVEDKELIGTVNALIKLQHRLGELFFVVNGDTYSTVDLREMLANYPNEIFTMTDGSVAIEAESADIMGTFLFSKKIFGWSKLYRVNDIDYEFFCKLSFDKRWIELYHSEASFIDIGTPEGLKKLRHRMRMELLARTIFREAIEAGKEGE